MLRLSFFLSHAGGSHSKRSARGRQVFLIGIIPNIGCLCPIFATAKKVGNKCTDIHKANAYGEGFFVKKTRSGKTGMNRRFSSRYTLKGKMVIIMDGPQPESRVKRGMYND